MRPCACVCVCVHECVKMWTHAWECACVLVGMIVLVAQLYLTLCDHMDYSPPGSSVQGILQARIMVWVAISFS